MEKSLNEETYEKLKQDIMTFRLAPGDVISAQKVATRFNVSRTPAREAIVKLEKEDLLKILPQSGTYVAKINTARAEQEWFVRMSLEVAMVDRFLENVNDDVIEKMEGYNNRLVNYDKSEESGSRVDIDNAFHQLIYHTTGENLAAEIIKMQMSHYDRIRYLAEMNQSISNKTNDEHRSLIEAARNKNKVKYLNIIQKHIYRILGEEGKLKERHPDYFGI
ncbi:MAG: GntR family transcriptional regulator [Eubacteriales bacterium]|nr:GntR family transcriptional regulator [Eubacteriales bacterium]